ncbi:hypothetical protein EON65_55390, partial [archaeon]
MEDIRWILARKGESQAAACLRANLEPINMDNVNIPWNFNTLSYVVNSQLNYSVVDTNSSYQGISGCCVSSLWCENTTCFTQNYGEQYVNYGWLSILPNAYPVYTCLNISINDTLILNRVDISNNAVLSVYGSSFGTQNGMLDASVNGYHCSNSELCNCLTCTAPNYVCPIGSVCAHISDINAEGPLCYKACAGVGDEACPCGYICSNAPDVFEEAVSLCLPPSNTLLNTCRNNGQSAMHCDAPYLYYDSYMPLTP